LTKSGQQKMEWGGGKGLTIGASNRRLKKTLFLKEQKREEESHKSGTQVWGEKKSPSQKEIKRDHRGALSKPKGGPSTSENAMG